MPTSPAPLHETLLANLLTDETFRPTEPRSVEETGLSPTLIEDLLLKYLLAIGSATGRDLATNVCLPFMILEDLFRTLRTRQLVVCVGSAQLGDYVYALTEQGRTRAQASSASCAYVGAAPVTLPEYVNSVEAQTVRAESPRRNQLEQAFSDISVNAQMFDSLGPAVNSGAGLFLYGEPGNGKTTLAKRITSCFGQTVFVPRVIVEDGQIVKVFDAAFHTVVEDRQSAIMKAADYDQRWVRIRRPTVIVGGELTLDALEIRHDPRSNVSEAPIQMKSNCGCLLIDDFGRQRVEPLALLNRWIVPLENRIDYLSLATGKKIQIPFEQLIIFSTNLEPADLVDEAFLRRIPYKIEITDPDEAEFHLLFELYAGKYDCDYAASTVDWLLETHYRPHRRAMRRCHPRDLLSQVRNFCLYNDYTMEMRPEYFDRVVGSYFTVVNGIDSKIVRGSKPIHNSSIPISRGSRPAAADAGDDGQPESPRVERHVTEAMPGAEPAAPRVERHVTEAMPGSDAAPRAERRITPTPPIVPSATPSPPPVERHITESMPGAAAPVAVERYVTEPMAPAQ
jgi:hypothetical protein